MQISKILIGAVAATALMASGPLMAADYVYPLVPLYQTYNPSATDYFYTTNETAYKTVVSWGWADQGIAAFVAPGNGWANLPDMKPFYRFYKGAPQYEHFYTISEAQKAAVVSWGWKAEGNEGYIFEAPPDGSPPQGTTPFYRLSKFDGSNSDLVHFYTTDAATKATLAGQGWNDEGAAGYVWAVPATAGVGTVHFRYGSSGSGRASDSAYITIPGWKSNDFSPYFGSCAGTVWVYRDGALISVIANWSYGTLPGSLSSVGCYSTGPISAFGGTSGYHVIQFVYSGSFGATQNGINWSYHISPPQNIKETWYFK